MKNNNIILVLCIFALISCKKNKLNSSLENLSNEKRVMKKTNKIRKDNLKLILEKELLAGFSTSSDNGEGPNFEVDINYFKTESVFLIELLKNNGYKFLLEQDFIDKVKLIFKYNLAKDIHSFYWKESCLEEIDDPFITWETNYEHLIFLKNKGFITHTFRLPEIIDYQKKYPELISVENTVKTKLYDKEGVEGEVIRWKDIEDLDEQRKFNIELLVNRNKYLFNDDKSKLPWLIQNDEYFMRNLVTTFGWTEDKKLVKWVVENTKFEYSYKENNGPEFEKILWHKDCNERLQILDETFELIKTMPREDSRYELYIEYLYDYVGLYLNNKDIDTSYLSFSEKAKIIAHILCLISEVSEENDYYQFKVGEFYEKYDLNQDYDKEFIKNNYYSIKSFKERWELAKEEGDGIWKPGDPE